MDLWNQEFLWLLHALTPLWGRAIDALDCIVKNFHSNIYSFVYDFYSVIISM